MINEAGERGQASRTGNPRPVLGAGTIGYLFGRWHGRREATHAAGTMLPPATGQDMTQYQG